MIRPALAVLHVAVAPLYPSFGSSSAKTSGL
jgi:hypothetical protein